MPFDPASYNNTNTGPEYKYGPPEPGDYEVKVVAANTFTGNSDGIDRLGITMRVTEGKHRNYEWGEIRKLEGDIIYRAKALLASLGIPDTNVNSLEELEDLMRPIIGSVFNCEAKRNGQWINASYTVARGGPPADVPADFDPAPASTGAAVAEDDIPF